MIDYEQIKREETPFAKRLAEWIRFKLNPETALDVGCGPGIYVDAMREFGVDATGIDTDDRLDAIGNHYLTKSSIVGNVYFAHLVLCLEVFEHIQPEQEAAAMDGLVEAVLPGGLLIFSAAAPGQGGEGHINCKSRVEWLCQLSSLGLTECDYIRSELLEYSRRGYHMGWFVNNLIVMTKPKSWE
jgi:2-polyprenyl-3-methyl-5-hydroxy-6-metoxy-1,4-benzoquinol methylase